MKKLFLVMISALAMVAAPVMADQDTYSKPGTFTAQAGLGFYWAYFGGLDIEGGADLSLAQVPFAPVFPVDFGVAGRVGVTTWGSLSAGAFGTAHYSWKALGINIDWVNKVETYLGVGVRILPDLGIDAYGGNSYHFDKNLAVFIENGYYNTIIGVSYKF